MPYKRKNIALDAISDRDNVLVDRGTVVNELFIIDMPAGATIDIRIGNNPDWITVTRPMFMEPQGDVDANGGVYWRNIVAQVGVVVTIYTVTGGAQLNTVLA